MSDQLPDDLPPILFINDLCRALRMSRSTFDRLNRARCLPIAPLPSFDKHLRWSRESVRAFLGQQADVPRRSWARKKSA